MTKRLPFHIVLPTAVALFVGATASVQAQTTWQGTTSSDWNTASNWTNGVPSSSVNPVFNSTGNQSTNVTFSANNSGKDLSFALGGTGANGYTPAYTIGAPTSGLATDIFSLTVRNIAIAAAVPTFQTFAATVIIPSTTASSVNSTSIDNNSTVGGALRLGGLTASSVTGAISVTGAAAGSISYVGLGGTTGSAINQVNGVVADSTVLNVPLQLNIGGSTWDLTNANTHSGGTIISNSSVLLGNNAALGTGALYLATGAATFGSDGRQATTTIGNQINVIASSGRGSTVIGNGNIKFTGGYNITSTAAAFTNALNISNFKTTEFSGPFTLNNAALTVTTNQGAGLTTLSGAIDGSSTGTLIYAAGRGTTLAISGNNTYTGATTFTAGGGTIAVNSAGALGQGANVLNLSSGTVFDNTSSGAVNLLNNGNVVFLTTSAVFAGSNSLSFGDSSFLSVTGASGTLTANGAGKTLSLGTISLNSTGTVAASDVFNGSGNIRVGGDIVPGNGNTLIGLTYAGTGTMTIAGAGSYTGATVVSGGTLALTGSLASTSALQFTNGGTFRMVGATTGTTTQTLGNVSFTSSALGNAMIVVDNNGGAGTTLNLGTLTRATGQTIDFVIPTNGKITTTSANPATGILGGGLTVNGTDWATVGTGGAITPYGGYTTLPTTGGTAATTNAIMNAGTTLTGNVTVNSLKVNTNGVLGLGANSLTLNGASGGLLVTANGGSVTGTGILGSGTTSEFIANVSSGNTFTVNSQIVSGTATSGRFTKSGAGTMNLTSANLYTGATVVTNGTLNLSGSLSVGSATGSPVTVNGLGANFTETSAGVIGGTTATFTLTNGAATLGGANTYGGITTVSNGTLTVANTAGLGASTAATALTITGNVATSPTVAFATDSSVAATNVTVTNTGGVATFRSDRATPGTGITQTLGTLTAAAVTLNATAGTNVTGGTPMIAFGATTLSNTAGNTTTFNPTTAGLTLTTVTNTATATNGNVIALNGSNANNAITGTISNGGTTGSAIAVVVGGSSTWALSGTNTYTGSTTVYNTGTLLINGANQGVGAVNVNSGTLGGNGSVAGMLSVGIGANLTPGSTGANTGVFTAGGGLTLNGNYLINLASAGISDQTSVVGALTLGTLSNLTVQTLAGTATVGQKFFIMLNDGTDAIGGQFGNYAQGSTVMDAAGDMFMISYTDDSALSSFGNDVSLTYINTVPIPEPRTSVICIMLTAVIGWRYRRAALRYLRLAA